MAIPTLDITGALPDDMLVKVNDAAQLLAGLLAAVMCWWTSKTTTGVESLWRRHMALPDDLKKMVIEEAIDHRKHLQRIESREMRLAEQGQVMAFATSIFFGIVALWATLAGHSEVGIVIAGTTIAALAAAFIVGRRYSGAAKPGRF